MYVKHYEPLLYQWVLNEHSGFKMDEYLLREGVKRVLIYGAGVIGECLYHILSGGRVDVIGFIDNEKSKHSSSIRNTPLYSLDKLPPEESFDAIIISVGHLFYQVSERLKEKYGDIGIISIEDIVFKNMSGDEI